jgi:hypothetical protein
MTSATLHEPARRVNAVTGCLVMIVPLRFSFPSLRRR